MLWPSQVFIDYGETGWRSSWEMAYTYGFVPGSGLEDWLGGGGRPVYFEGILPTDTLGPQKRAVLAALGAEEDAWEGMWIDLKPSQSQCEAMGPMLRLAHLSDGENNNDSEVTDGGSEAPDSATATLASQLAQWTVPPKELWEALQKPLDADTETRVAQQVPTLPAPSAAPDPCPTLTTPSLCLGPRPREATQA